MIYEFKNDERAGRDAHRRRHQSVTGPAGRSSRSRPAARRTSRSSTSSSRPSSSPTDPAAAPARLLASADAIRHRGRWAGIALVLRLGGGVRVRLAVRPAGLRSRGRLAGPVVLAVRCSGRAWPGSGCWRPRSVGAASGRLDRRGGRRRARAGRPVRRQLRDLLRGPRDRVALAGGADRLHLPGVVVAVLSCARPPARGPAGVDRARDRAGRRRPRDRWHPRTRCRRSAACCCPRLAAHLRGVDRARGRALGRAARDGRPRPTTAGRPRRGDRADDDRDRGASTGAGPCSAAARSSRPDPVGGLGRAPRRRRRLDVHRDPDVLRRGAADRGGAGLARSARSSRSGRSRWPRSAVRRRPDTGPAGRRGPDHRRRGDGPDRVRARERAAGPRSASPTSDRSAATGGREHGPRPVAHERAVRAEADEPEPELDGGAAITAAS